MKILRLVISLFVILTLLGGCAGNPPAHISQLEEKVAALTAENDALRRQVQELAAKEGSEVLPICAKLEADIAELDDPDEKAMFMEELGIKETGLARVIRTGYRLLDYITFFTAGPMESRAWTVTRGTPAPQAAGKIHTDLCRGFIRMETVSYEDLVAAGGWAKAQAAGKLRIEGKEYLIQDGDVIHVRFSV